MPATLTTADAALKEDYQPVIREQLNNGNKLLSQLEKNTHDVEGRRAVLSLHTSRNSGVGNRAESATLPTPGNQGYQEERVPVKYAYGQIKVTGPVIRASKSDKGSFTRQLDAETKGVVADLKRDVNRQLFGTSNGVVATCGTTTASTTVVLATTTTATQLRQIADLGVIDIGTVAAPTMIASARTITSIDTANKTLVISGAAVTTSASHFLFKSGSGGVGIEFTGLQTIVASTGSLYNVDPATVPLWASTVADNSGTNRAVSDTLFEKMINDIEIASGEEADLIVTTAGVNRGYAASLKSLRRFSNTIELKGGFKVPTVQTGTVEIGLMWDRDCKENTAYVLNTKHLTEYMESDWEFMQEDGAVLQRALDGSDAYQATLFKYMDVMTDRRNTHGVIKDLTES